MKQFLNAIDLPTHELPLFEESPGEDYVLYGHDNMYPDYLRDLYLGSSLQTAVVNGISEMIYGEGLDATDREEEPKKAQWLKLQGLLDSSEDNLLRRMSLDLKLYGMAYVQVIYNRLRTEVAEMRHVPAQMVRSGHADSQGKVHAYYVSPRWDMVNEAQNTPVSYPAFNDKDRTAPVQILQIKAYQPGVFYYGLPDYVGATNYIELDREIGVFHLNNIKNGLFPSMMLSFNNGQPTEEERRIIENKVNEKFSGSSNAGRVLISFNDGSENAPQLTPINANAAEGMYEMLSKECTIKILAGHRVTSPLLFGIRGDGSGFGNNADEIRDSFSLFHNTVIVPFQNMLLEGLQPIFSMNGIQLDLYMKPLKPADFIDVDAVKAQDEATQEKEGLDSDDPTGYDFGAAFTQLSALGEDEPEGYTLIDSRPVDYEAEDKQDAMWAFARAVPGGGGADGESKDDTPLIKVRYKYAPDIQSPNTRQFCKDMLAAGQIYKKEDILKASRMAVNPGWGPNGRNTYSIWLYKGGGNCQHFWERRTYLKEDDSTLSVNQAKRIIREAGPDAKRLPENDRRVAQRPRDMPNAGFLKPR